MFSPKQEKSLINLLTSNYELRPAQYLALKQGLLKNRKNFIVSSPTNSGKSFIGWLSLIQAVHSDRRAILLEPLRSLAQEKTMELQLIAQDISKILGKKITLRISTGDYRLNHETFFDSAPDGELIIATPERFESIIRNQESGSWLDTIGTVCIDEAHLIGNVQRGPILEHLITSLLTLPNPPRLILLSATLGNLEKAKAWLMPCEVVHVTERYPALHKHIIELQKEQDVDNEICAWLKESIHNSSQAIVFVYQTAVTEKLAKLISSELANQVGVDGALFYHSKMSIAQKEYTRQAFLEGRSKIIVTTSALAMGINLPATHVAVRDLTYHGATSPSVSDLLQMMGRAGRGEQEGHAVVFKRPTDDWTTSELQHALDNEILPEFKSVFATESKSSKSTVGPAAATSVTSLLARKGEQGMSKDDLETFFNRSLGGQHLCEQIPGALRWLEYQTLVYRENNKYNLTVLGQKACRAVLPLSLASGLAQLLRDILTIDPKDALLTRWQPLDHLLVLNLLHDRVPSLRTFSANLLSQVESWCEKPGNKSPILFSKWISGEKGYSKAIEVLGALGIYPEKSGKAGEEWARRKGYVATFNSIVLFERGLGKSTEDLNRQFKIKNFDGIEERYRDDFLWLLAGVAELLDIRTFFYHLKEDCGATQERIQSVKLLLGKMRHQVYDLMEQLKYCSALGPLLRTIKRTGKGGVGIKSIRTLENAGYNDLVSLSKLSIEDIAELGVKRNIAKQIYSYIKKTSI